MNYDLHELIPHRAPMILIDRAVELCQAWAICEVEIKTASLFCKDGKVPNWVGIEYMAQTIAAYSSYIDICNVGKSETKIGLLLAARKFQAKVDHYKIGQRLLVKVEPTLIDGGIGSFKCSIKIDGQIVAEAMLTTFKPAAEDLLKMSRQE